MIPPKADTMVAGREMDALVAEKIFGCRVVTNAVMQLDCGCQPDRIHGTLQRHLKEYSTNIAAAWEIVEKLYTDEKGVTLNTIFGGWYCSLGGVHSTIKGNKKAAPLAICRAALMVSGKL